jgi:hypothetical protein
MNSFQIPGTVKSFKCTRVNGSRQLEVTMEALEGGLLSFKTMIDKNQRISTLFKVWCQDMSVLLTQNLD